MLPSWVSLNVHNGTLRVLLNFKSHSLLSKNVDLKKNDALGRRTGSL